MRPISRFVLAAVRLILLFIIAFMKDMGIVYEETHLYKIDTSKMQECKISFNGLLSMNFDQLEEGYRKFKSWDANVH